MLEYLPLAFSLLAVLLAASGRLRPIPNNVIARKLTIASRDGRRVVITPGRILAEDQGRGRIDLWLADGMPRLGLMAGEDNFVGLAAGSGIAAVTLRTADQHTSVMSEGLLLKAADEKQTTITQERVTTDFADQRVSIPIAALVEQAAAQKPSGTFIASAASNL